jgi:hypothetical protein
MRSSLKKLISACRTARHATCPIVASLGVDDPR